MIWLGLRFSRIWLQSLVWFLIRFIFFQLKCFFFGLDIFGFVNLGFPIIGDLLENSSAELWNYPTKLKGSLGSDKFSMDTYHLLSFFHLQNVVFFLIMDITSVIACNVVPGPLVCFFFLSFWRENKSVKKQFLRFKNFTFGFKKLKIEIPSKTPDRAHFQDFFRIVPRSLDRRPLRKRMLKPRFNFNIFLFSNRPFLCLEVPKNFQKCPLQYALHQWRTREGGYGAAALSKWSWGYFFQIE